MRKSWVKPAVAASSVPIRCWMSRRVFSTEVGPREKVEWVVPGGPCRDDRCRMSRRLRTCQ